MANNRIKDTPERLEKYIKDHPKLTGIKISVGGKKIGMSNYLRNIAALLPDQDNIILKDNTSITYDEFISKYIVREPGKTFTRSKPIVDISKLLTQYVGVEDKLEAEDKSKGYPPYEKEGKKILKDIYYNSKFNCISLDDEEKLSIDSFPKEDIDNIRELYSLNPDSTLRSLKRRMLKDIRGYFAGNNIDAISFNNYSNIKLINKQCDYFSYLLGIDFKKETKIQESIKRIVKDEVNRLSRDYKGPNVTYKNNAQLKCSNILEQWDNFTDKENLNELKDVKYTLHNVKNKSIYNKNDYYDLLENAFIASGNISYFKDKGDFMTPETLKTLSAGFPKSVKINRAAEFVSNLFNNDLDDLAFYKESIKGVETFIDKYIPSSIKDDPKFKNMVKNNLIEKYASMQESGNNKITPKEFKQLFSRYLGRFAKLPKNSTEAKKFIKKSKSKYKKEVKAIKLTKDLKDKIDVVVKETVNYYNSSSLKKLLDNMKKKAEEISVNIKDKKEMKAKFDSRSGTSKNSKAYGMYNESHKEIYDKIMKKDFSKVFDKLSPKKLAYLRGIYKSRVIKLKSGLEKDKNKELTSIETQMVAVYNKLNNKYLSLIESGKLSQNDANAIDFLFTGKKIQQKFDNDVTKTVYTGR